MVQKITVNALWRNNKLGSGCFKISYYDEFMDSELNEVWSINVPEHGSRGAAFALDGSESLRFIPENPAYVEVIRSSERINWPILARATVEKRTDECNLFSIGLEKYGKRDQQDQAELIGTVTEEIGWQAIQPF